MRDRLDELGPSSVAHTPRLHSGDGGDVTNEQAYRGLIERGGQDRLPYFIDTGREETLYESDDIVDYPEDHYGSSQS